METTERLSKYDIAARVMLEGLDGFDGKLPAAKQREVFGRALFGKKTIHIDAEGQGTIRVWWSVCFGTMTDGRDLTFEEVAQIANDPLQRVRW
jgi:hypothetical protein